MNKINLLTSNDDLTSFNAQYFQNILMEYFNISYYDPKKTYNKNDTIVVTGLVNKNKWYSQLEEENFKIIIENLWEQKQKSDKFVCHADNWFWYNESLWYRHLKYNNYIPDKTYNKLAFMPIRRPHDTRDLLIKTLESNLKNFIYSYVEKGIYLPGDLKIEDKFFQRHFNPSWYNDTYFSIVAETKTDHRESIFVTEKTFKPIAFNHPFIIFGQPGILEYIKNLGFVTFNNLFDESYDSIIDIKNRVLIIANNVVNFKKVPYDKLTIDKINHNKDLFYNEKIVKEKIIQEIINPILEYAN